jgi:hypothetical protein
VLPTDVRARTRGGASASGSAGSRPATREPFGDSKPPGRRARVLPQLDLDRSVVPVDADVCLDEPGNEYRRNP